MAIGATLTPSDIPQRPTSEITHQDIETISTIFRRAHIRKIPICLTSLADLTGSGHSSPFGVVVRLL
jgi:hypothetical protein